MNSRITSTSKLPIRPTTSILFLLIGIGTLCSVIDMVSAFQDETSSSVQPNVESQRQAAIVNAIQLVQGAVIRLETFSSDEVAPSVGSGFVIEEGYVVTSSFFVRSSSTKVFAKDKSNAIPLTVIGTDRSRNLTFLKLKATDRFATPKLSQREIEVGESVIAMGRTLSEQTVNVSLGIVSAKQRIFGKAIQTDSKISPTNYGGPLVDLNGEIVGALVALSPDSSELDAGAEWYDSGIGFAIPIKDVQRSLSLVKKLAAEKNDSTMRADLFPGKLGLRFSAKNIYADPLIVAAVLPRSPASEAGIRVGALVTKVNGQPVTRLAQFQSIMGRLYASETLTLQLLDQEKSVAVKCTLTDSISPFQFGYIGVLPDLAHSGVGIKIKAVDQESFAKSSLLPGDLIQSINGIEMTSIADAAAVFSKIEAGQKVLVNFVRDGVEKSASILLGELSKPISVESYGELNPPELKKELVRTEIRVPGLSNRCTALIPRQQKAADEKFDDSKEKGIKEKTLTSKVRVLVWLPETNDVDFEGIKKKWEAILCRQNIALLMPLPSDVKGWSNDEREFVWKATREFLRRQPNVINRVIYCGTGKGAAICLKLVAERRESVIGLVLSDPDFTSDSILPFSDPQNRLFVKCLLSRERMIGADSLRRAFIKNQIPVAVSKIENPKRFSLNDLEAIETWLMLLNRL